MRKGKMEADKRIIELESKINKLEKEKRLIE
jgi:uncharacterized coiled-coil protein SlyX